MRAVLCREFGPPESLKIEDVAPPEPGEGQIALAVHAAGVNFADTLIIEGKYQDKPEMPFSPGMEAAGVVSKVGAGVTGLKEGDRVTAMLGHGGFAEEALAPASGTMKIPDSMDFVDAAGFPVAYGTSHVALRHRGDLKAGETLLVHGAAGGVGLTAVQIGRVLGANVIGTARGQDKLDIARTNGAKHVIDYAEEDIRTKVLEITEKRGADVIYDPVGGDVFDASLRCIAWEGRLLVIGFAGGRIPQAPANYLLVKNCSVVGVFWGAYRKHNPRLIDESFEELFGWYDDGLLRPHVSNTFELDEVADAMQMMLERKSTGKIVITTGLTHAA